MATTTRKRAPTRTAAKQAADDSATLDRIYAVVGWLVVFAAWLASGAFTAWLCTRHPDFSWPVAFGLDATLGAGLFSLLMYYLSGRR